MKLFNDLLVLSAALVAGSTPPPAELPERVAAPAEGSVSILLLTFESRTAGLSDSFTAELRRLLDQKSGYSTMSVKDAARRLPKMDFKPELNCNHGRQLATYVDVDFMACGSIQEIASLGYLIDLTIIHTTSQSSIMMHGIHKVTVQDAAEEIGRRITRFVEEDMRR